MKEQTKRYLKVGAVAVPVVFFAVWVKLYFLILPLVVGVWFYLYSKQWERMRRMLDRIPPKRRRVTSWVTAFVVAQVIVNYVMLYFVDLGRYTMPWEGEVLTVVNKAKYGAICHGDDVERYYRTCRVGKIERNDWAVVQVPTDDGERAEIILRVVARPGETVELRDGAAYVDGEMVDKSGHVTARYNMVSGTSQKALRTMRQQCQLDSLDDTARDIEMPVVRRENEWKPYTTSAQLRNMTDLRLYPHDRAYHWNAMHWGPLRMPRKGDSIELTPLNVALYGPMVAENEGAKIEMRDGKATVDGREAERYTFRCDYYFCLCDRREVCNDSRLYGPIPENRIVGSAMFSW